jgi:hypothetical protein
MKNNKKLKFVHITKTSGTYIENLGKQKNINWGRHDKCLKKRKGGYWHFPLQFLNTYPYKDNIKLFTIVRNPYDRIISECLCKYGSTHAKKMETKKDLNIYINEQVSIKKKLNLSFLHFLPQHLYTHKEGKQIIDFIIKYEEINKFNDLMKDYSIDIKYVQKKNNKNKKFNVNDISKENIDLINNVYHLDFVYYNYKKM